VPFVVIRYFGICILLAEELAHTSSPWFPSVVAIPIFKIELFARAMCNFFRY
jgi:hypothetical protein